MDPTKIDDENFDYEPKPKPQVEYSGSGGGKQRTAIGLGGGDGNWYSPREIPSDDEDPRRPVLNEHLKEIAIDALEASNPKERQTVYSRLRIEFNLQEGEFAEIQANVLAELAVSAYTVAQFIPSAYLIDELRLIYGCFTDNQLKRIIEIAQKDLYEYR